VNQTITALETETENEEQKKDRKMRGYRISKMIKSEEGMKKS